MGYKVKLRLDYFAAYARQQRDDSPLYIFDADFGDEGKPTQPLLNEFAVPEYFREDLFQYVGEDRRPPYRWLLLRPKTLIRMYIVRVYVCMCVCVCVVCVCVCVQICMICMYLC